MRLHVGTPSALRQCNSRNGNLIEAQLLMVYIAENAIANRIRSRAFGFNGRAA